MATPSFGWTADPCSSGDSVEPINNGSHMGSEAHTHKGSNSDNRGNAADDRLSRIEKRLDGLEANFGQTLRKLDLLLARPSCSCSGGTTNSQNSVEMMRTLTPSGHRRNLSNEIPFTTLKSEDECSGSPKKVKLWERALNSALPGSGFSQLARGGGNGGMASLAGVSLSTFDEALLEADPDHEEKLARHISTQISRFFMEEEHQHDVKVIDSDMLDDAVPKIINPSGEFMLDPTKQFRMFWDLCLIMPFLVYLVVVMPFRMGFQNEAPKFTAIYWFEFFIDMIFVLDIGLNFCTGYFVGRGDLATDEPLIEFDRWMVAKNYLRSWFFLDVTSGVPFALLELVMEASGGAGALKSAKALKLLRFLKLGRLLKLEKVFSNLDRDTLDRIEDFFQSPSTRTTVVLLQLGVTLGYVCHLLACGFVFVGRMGAKVKMKPSSWFAEDNLGPFDGSDTTEGDKVSTIYLAAFYFCLTTMTSVGYGDIITHNNLERIYAIVTEFVGAIVFALIVASLTSIVSSMDVATRRTAEQLDTVSSFVAQREFPEALGRRIRRHFRHYYSLKSEIDEGKIFSMLTTSLRRQVSEYLIQEVMGVHSVFMAMPPLLWPKLLPLLKPLRFEKEELVQTQNEECTEMFVVLNGSLEAKTILPNVTGGSAERVRHVLKGGTLNTLCVLGVWPQCIETVTAVLATELYAVGADEFIELFGTDSDKDAFARMQLAECQHYKCVPAEKAPTSFGQPLYLCSFSTVCVDVRAARAESTEADRLRDKTNSSGSVGLETYVVVDLVDIHSKNPFNDIWRLRTSKATTKMQTRKQGELAKALSALLAHAAEPLSLKLEPQSVNWMDINVPFDKCALRIRLFQSESRHHDTLSGQAVVSLADLESDVGGLEGDQGSPDGFIDRWVDLDPPPPAKKFRKNPKKVFGRVAIDKLASLSALSEEKASDEMETGFSKVHPETPMRPFGLKVRKAVAPYHVQVRIKVQRPEHKVRRLKFYQDTLYETPEKDFQV